MSDTSLSAWGKVFLVVAVLLVVLAITTGVDGGSGRSVGEIAECEERQRQIQDAMNEARPNLPGSFEPEWDCDP